MFQGVFWEGRVANVSRDIPGEAEVEVDRPAGNDIPVHILSVWSQRCRDYILLRSGSEHQRRNICCGSGESCFGRGEKN